MSCSSCAASASHIGNANLHSSRPSHEFLHNNYRTRGRRVARLPLHLVGLVTVPEAESAGEVAAKEVLLLDGGQDGLVNGLLVAGAGAGNLLLLLLFLELATHKPSYRAVIGPDLSYIYISRSNDAVHVPRASLPA